MKTEPQPRPLCAPRTSKNRLVLQGRLVVLAMAAFVLAAPAARAAI